MRGAAAARVIAIAAPPGGGKTTLSGLLSARLGGCPVLHFDDHEVATRRAPAEVAAWLDRGAPLEEIAAPGFAEGLSELRGSDAAHILVDGPLGRAYPRTAHLIDLVIYIDTPLDLALARVMGGQAAHAARALEPGAPRQFAQWLEAYLANYQGFIRRSYAMQRDVVLPGADLVLDGALPMERLVDLALDAINRRRP